MKRLLAFVLAFTMLLSVGVTALAEVIPEVADTYTEQIPGETPAAEYPGEEEAVGEEPYPDEAIPPEPYPDDEEEKYQDEDEYLDEKCEAFFQCLACFGKQGYAHSIGDCPKFSNISFAFEKCRHPKNPL